MTSDDISELLMYKILDRVYPIGALYFDTTVYASAADIKTPTQILGFGVWVQIESKFIRGVAAAALVGAGGGSDTHVHALDSATSHAKITVSTASPWLFQRRKNISPSYTATHQGPAGNGAGSTASQGAAAELGGDSASASTLPAYADAYIWKRTA